MRKVLKNIGLSVGLLLLFLVGCIAADQIPHSKAKPPKTVIDLNSYLVWHPKPMGAYRISSGTNTYYMVTGPAGRYIPSGPAGYAFDERGRFLAWSSDIGDFKNPPEIFGDRTKKKRITLEEIKTNIAQANP